MAKVVFDAAEFKAQYPLFAAVDDAFLQNCFNQATMYLSNKDCSIVQDLEQRKMLLYLLTAHIAYLLGALNPGGMPMPLGRTANATEGSVSVGYSYGPVTPRSEWYLLSQWGQLYWNMTEKYRSFRYRARPTCY